MIKKNKTFVTIISIFICFFASGLSAQTATAPSAGSGTVGDPYEIATLENLYWIASSTANRDKHYIQTADIDASETSTWAGGGWTPIGVSGLGFTGSYNGGGHIIDGLYINRSADYQGLFGVTGNATIKNLGVTDVDITGLDRTGGVVGMMDTGSTLDSCFATGSVSGSYNMGLLVGRMVSSAVSKCYSSGSVDGGTNAGGLIGWAGGDLNASYSIATVTGDESVGGLVGLNGSNMSNCYGMGSVSGTTKVGGLVGNNGGTINYCYSTGSVSGDTEVGGLIGDNNFIANNCMWDTESSGQAASAAGTGKTTAEMQDIATFIDAGWDFAGESTNGDVDNWGINSTDNGGYPFLTWQGYTPITPPKVSTQAVTNITSTTVTGNGTIIDLGLPEPIQHGVCYSRLSIPTVADSLTDEGAISATGAFTTEITGLTPNTTYYARAYASNSEETSYGDAVSFTTGNIEFSVPTVGDGSAGNPYQIANLENLYWITAPNSVVPAPDQAARCAFHYLQIADIDASKTASWDDGDGSDPEGWIPIGYSGNEFSGVYDGGGYTIDGLYINRIVDYQGLIGFADNGTIKNLGILNANVSGNKRSGALVGSLSFSSTVENCYSTGTMSGVTRIGGLVGFNNSSSIISFSYSSCQVTGVSEVGGLVGTISSSTISNSYSLGDVTRESGTETSLGGFSGYIYPGTIENCYATGAVAYAGETNPVNKGFLGAENGTNTYTNNVWDTEASGQSSAIGATGKTTLEMKTYATYEALSWDFLEETINGTDDIWGFNPAENSGYPFLSWQGFTATMVASVTTQDATNILETTATANGNVTALGSANPTQHGFCWSTSTNPTTADSKTEEGAVAGIGAFSSDITGLTPGTTYYVRAYVTNEAGTIYGNEITFTSLAAPTITTQAVTNITSTTATGNGDITYMGVPDPTQYGVCWSTSQNPTLLDSKTEEGAATAGGPFTTEMTGLTANTVYYVRAYATNAVETVYGEEVAFSTQPLEPVVPTGSGTQEIPYEIATLANLYWLTQNSDHWDKYYIQTADIDLSVSATWDDGDAGDPEGMPLIGNNTTAFSGSYNGDGSIIDGLYIDRDIDNVGLFGKTNGCTIENLGLTGVDVTGLNVVGGLVGLMEQSSVVNNCFCEGTVTGVSRIGVLAGFNTTGSVISNCYSMGSVSGVNVIGGLLGNNYPGSSVINCYSIATVSGDTDLGGLMGRNQGTESNSFWDTETSGLATSFGGTGKTTAEMHVISTFTDAGWDFAGETSNGADDIWGINPAENNGYPFLSWQGYTPLAQPVLSTQEVANITLNTATGNGTIVELGTSDPTQYGVCWSTAENPTITDSKTEEGAASATGAFTSELTGLTPGTVYYVRAYATNAVGTSYGEQVSFTSLKLASVSTQAVTSIGTTTATGNGSLDDVGIPNPSQHGICWSTAENPTITDSKTEEGAASATGTFSSELTGLTPGTIYYVKAYAINTAGTVYGEEVSFTTMKAPTVSTQDVSVVTPTTAVGNGTIDFIGVPEATEHGICWSTSNNPTVSDTKASLGEVTAEGAFTADLTGLIPGTTYYVRAYATNTVETVYGAEVIFTALKYAVVNTLEVTEITTTSVTAHATISDLGVPGPTQHGVCWSSTENPTVDDTKTEEGAVAATGAFTSEISGLSPNAIYHVRAYVTNEAGTVYSENVTFYTDPIEMIVPAGDGSEEIPYQISSLSDLFWVAKNNTSWDKYFIQTADIDASQTSSWYDGMGWNPIGNEVPFSGTYNGDGYSITGLYINRSTDNVGLFGGTTGSTIEKLGLIGAEVTGNNHVGGIVGTNDQGSIISNCYCDAIVNGTTRVGVLVGFNSGSSIENCYSLGTVSGTSEVGGLAGNNYWGSSVQNCYSVSLVSGTSDVGGLVGENRNLVTNSFWDIETSGQQSSAGGQGKTTAEMKTMATYTASGWDFAGEITNGSADYWGINSADNGGYPFLMWQGFTPTASPAVSTQAVTDITTTTATGNGTLVEPGLPVPSQHGVCWSESANPSIDDFKTEEGQLSETGIFGSDITGLTAGKTYYLKAYAINDLDTVYGEEVMFTTLILLPVVSTDEVTEITQTSATCKGTVSDLGNPQLTNYGMCWSINENPAITDSKTEEGAASAIGAFTSELTGLTPGTVYYVRAYATSAVGTSYGEQVSFTSLKLPSVSTQAVMSIGTTSATGNGSLDDVGIPNSTQHGICWSTTSNPTVDDNKTELGATAVQGAFLSDMTGLTPGTVYYVRAYAINTAGTVYGEEVSFTTMKAPTVSTQEVSDVTPTTAVGNGTIDFIGVPEATEHGICWSTSNNPTVSDTKASLGEVTAEGAFTADLTGLIPGTTYYARAYATNTVETVYGAEVIFTSMKYAVVNTLEVTEITTTSVTAHATISELGVPGPTQHGVCWSSTENPTVDDTKTEEGAVAATGAFTSEISGLSPNTIYHVRAYVTNEAGTVYSENVTFYTDPIEMIVPAGDGSEETPYQISSLSDLFWVAKNNASWDKYFIQTADIDASQTSSWYDGMGWNPIGNSVPFSGNYNGDGYSITGLYINRSTDNIGLFGGTNGSTIEKLALIGAEVTGNNHVGGIVGINDQGSTLSNCYCDAIVNGTNRVGVLVGFNATLSTITNCYSLGIVSGAIEVGGLTGNNYLGALVQNCYSISSVSGTSDVGGLIGLNENRVNNSFWDTETSGQQSSSGGDGKTTSEMKTMATYTALGWDFAGESVNGIEDIWGINPAENNGYPFLIWQDFTPVASPVVSTQAVTDITDTTATGNATIVNVGLPAADQHGVCWSTSADPVITDSKTEEGIVTTTGPFTTEVIALTPGTTYYLRAYAINSSDTVYGEVVEFTTLMLPGVTTQEITSIGETNATVMGTITDMGIPALFSYGACWSTTSNPTTDDVMIEGGYLGEPQAFVIDMYNLEPDTEYYVRAFATNVTGTAYGEEISFKTLPLDDAISLSEMDFNCSVYPNPVKTSFRISLTLNKSNPVKIILYDMKGRAVKIIEEKVMIADNYELEVVREDLKPGVYTLRIQIGTQQDNRKLILQE